MSWLARILNVVRPATLDRRLNAELSFHIEERTDELVAAGMPEPEARHEALRRFGGYTLQKERTQDMNISRALEAFLADLRYGLRQLRLAPGFTAVAVLSLGLGIGANTAIFQLIDALRLRALPVREPSRLISVDTIPPFHTSGWYMARNRAFTFAQFQQISQRQQAFEGIMAFGTDRFNLARGGESRYAEGLYVTANYFDVLGVTPLLGRTFTPEEGGRDCATPTAVISYSFWQREFGGVASVLDRTISLNGQTFHIVGVTPPSFFGVEPARRFDVAMPLCGDTAIASEKTRIRLDRKDAWWLTPIARLKPGWTLERASAHLTEISPAVFANSVSESWRPETVKNYLTNKVRAISASAGVSRLRADYENPLWILLATTALVLLIACANLANLLLARASVRQREIAVRQAIGASRRRVVGQLLAESLLLAAFGAALGALLSQFLSRALVTFIDNGAGRLHLSLGVDWHVFWFTAGLALLTCLIFGLAPAIGASRTDAVTAMRAGRGAAASSERGHLRRLLVVSQIALSLVLLVGALLFGRSLYNILQTQSGMNTEGVLIAGIDASVRTIPPERRQAVYDQLIERIQSQPGVVSVAAVMLHPFSGAGWNQDVQANTGPNAKKVISWMNAIGPGYFKTMDTRMLAGRDFTPADDTKAPLVSIVNESFARQIMDGGNPVGRTFRVQQRPGTPDRIYQIVGLVADTSYYTLRDDKPPIAYFPLRQEQDGVPDSVSIMVRTNGPFADVMALVRRHMTEIHPQLLVDFRFLSREVQSTMLRERLMANLSGGFGVLAILLSALGLYGVMSYAVARRRSEIGVRVAMGASARDILALVFKEASLLVAIGLGLGLAASYGVSRFAESLLFGLKPNDAFTLGAACALLAAIAFFATLVPARRALQMDPAVALREE
ncbi:MAG: ABC transporter permease [Bryobacteraceae bacterium]|nr:ABC transporter permease [Bryobacteraceae bacterium]